MTLKALIFDVDGTLAETEDCHREAFNQCFVEAGMTDNGKWIWDKALYRELLKTTGGKERMRAYVELENLEEPDVIKLHARKTEIYNENIMTGKVPLRPGVERLIREARAQGMRMAIATTTSLPNVHSLLTVNLGEGSVDWFEVMSTAEDVSRKKPDPEVFQIAIDRMGLKAEECLAFEDSRNGLRSATDIKIPTLVTPSIYTDDQDFSEAMCVISTLGECDALGVHIAGKKINGGIANISALEKLFR